MQAFRPAEQRIISGVRTLLTVTAPFWAYSLVFPSGYPYATGLVGVPVLIIVNAFLIARVSREDELLAKLLPVAFLLKLAAAAMYLLLVQHAGGDLIGYNHLGSQIASDFLITKHWSSFTVSRMGWWGPSLLVCDLLAALYVVTGPSISIGMVVFSTISFWGQYFAYRAFTLGFPNGQRSRAALLLLLFPSVVFWTATIGKDAILGFSIWFAVYGFAQLVRTPGIRAYVYIVAGLLGAYFMRPHIAAMLAIAFTAAFVFGRNVRGFAGIAFKILSTPLLVYGTIWLFRRAQEFMRTESFSQALLVINKASSYSTNFGGSQIGSRSLAVRIVSSPFLVFRPFPWEVNNLLSASAAAEALLLLALLWVSRDRLKSAARAWRSDPFLLFTLLYIVGFSTIMSLAFSNIGLIARQRVMMLPSVLMLICVPRALRSMPMVVRKIRRRSRFQWSNPNRSDSTRLACAGTARHFSSEK